MYCLCSMDSLYISFGFLGLYGFSADKAELHRKAQIKDTKDLNYYIASI